MSLEDDPTATMVKRHPAMKKVMYAISSEVRDWSKLSKEETDVAMNAYFHQSEENIGLRHLISGKLVCKSALMLEETTLNFPKIL
ncbi:hypothetical protein TNCV_4818491 [Trichonephila clavipes]|nr:hypothetical protein TNCV_4818491 [Trichonephila clavipes]